MMLTLGSLFDGIGGWLLAAQHNGVKPIWSSEIERFPLAVTRARFPEVVQLGDVTKIDGGKIQPCDILCAGSPCQNLSTAGKKEGLQGEQSRLFFYSVEIVRRMRDATGGRYPRWFVWENVCGALTSGIFRGADFRSVLETVGETSIPIPERNNWATAGLAELKDRQIAWRVLNAEHWGVPQRRRRIFLVCDFGTGQRRAGEVLFVEPGVRGNTQTRENQKSETSGRVTEGAGSAGWAGIYDIRITSEGTRNIRANCYKTDRCRSLDTHAPDPSTNHGGPAVILDKSYGVVSKGNGEAFLMEERHMSLGCGGGQADQGYPAVLSNSTVRRLTPLECERLQGLPDNYTLIDDPCCTEVARFKALGNGMAQPCPDFVIQRIKEVTCDT